MENWGGELEQDMGRWQIGRWTALSGLLVVVACSALVRADDEEFVGPFASWRNVKSDYGAKGDGQADDLAAIQRALDDLRLHRGFCVLYFPAGTYRIRGSLRTIRQGHQDCMGVAIVGQDPATTIIQWDGPAEGTMVHLDAWYSRISRLTLDGAGKARVALNWGPSFSTYNETSDMVFKDVGIGMLMGGGGNGQAENEVLRCRFVRCAQAGLMTVDFNSMDIWVWYSQFEDCGHGLYNRAGNFHAYQNVFLRSSQADVAAANLMVFSFVNNTSIGSRCFLDFANGHTWGAQTSITGNRIVGATGEWAMRLGNGGPYLVADNRIRARAGHVGPLVQMTWGDQTFVGNAYSQEQAVAEGGRFVRFAEKTVASGAIDASPPKLPPTPPQVQRRVFEVPAGAEAATIQAAIDEAAKLQRQRPVVHLPQGLYKINRTLVVPAGSDVQIVGDGAGETGTVLEWRGEHEGLVMLLQGPSQATLRDFSIHATNASGIRAENADQEQGRVFFDQVNVAGMSRNAKSKASLRLNGLQNSDVLLRCLQGGGGAEKWVEVIGPDSRPQKGQIAIFNGATGTSEAQYAVSKNARLLVRGVYHEMDAEAPQGILLEEPGELTVDSTRFSYKTSPEHPLIEAKNFRGRFALLSSLLLPVDSTHTARLQITGSGQECRLLCMNSTFWVNELGVEADKVLLNQAHPQARAALLNCNVNSNLAGATERGFGFLENRGPADEAFVLEMLKGLRDGRPWLPEPRAESLTDLRLHRIICRTGGGSVGIELKSAAE